MIYNQYRRSIVRLLTEVRQLQLDPWIERDRCYAIQKELVHKTVHVEKRIQESKTQIKNLKKRLSVKPPHHLTKEEAAQAKKRIASYEAAISEAKHFLSFLKEIGDALAFIYLDKYDVKPFIFKETSGFIHGKEGFKLEQKYVQLIFKRGGIAILNDLTNSLRHGDITVLNTDNPPAIVEVKSSGIQNNRVLRQKDAVDKLIEYMNTDQMLMDNQLVRRVSLSESEVNHIDRLNHLLAHAKQNEFGFEEIEPGLCYYVETLYEPNRFASLFSRFTNLPMVFFLNMGKYEARGYYPFTLSIAEPEMVVDFYAGIITIFVLIEPVVMTEIFASQGFTLEFMDMSDYAFRVARKDSTLSSERGWMQIGCSDPTILDTKIAKFRG